MNDAIEKKELHLSAFDKNLLREFVDIFERFEDATDILQGDQYVSISLGIPCYSYWVDEASRRCKKDEQVQSRHYHSPYFLS